MIFRAADAKQYVTPSPGAYEAADTNRYKNKSPSFSLSTRYTVPSDHTMKPGPGAYSPEKVHKSNQSPHFGDGKTVLATHWRYLRVSLLNNTLPRLT